MGKNMWKIAFTYVGAIVGAGFASGQELVRFFVVFNQYGLWGTLFTGVIFAFLGAVVSRLANKFESKDYGQLLESIFPLQVSKLFDIIIALTLWLGLGVMLTGSATLLTNQFNLGTIAGFSITAFLVFCCLQVGSQGLLNTNTLLVPLLIILAVGTSLIYILEPLACLNTDTLVKSLMPNWWSASLLYVAYNMVLGIVVLASIQDSLGKVTPWGGVVGGLILGVMSFTMVKGLQLLPPDLLMAEMPMLALTKGINPFVGQIYGFGLWIALFTTALANAHALTCRLESYFNKPYRLVLVTLILSAFCFMPWQFSTLVGIVYPLEGYLAVPIIIAIIIAALSLE